MSLIRGENVENLRMTSDIGMGIIKAVPTFALPLLLLEHYFLHKDISIPKAAVFSVLMGLFLFFMTAARGGILEYLMVFLVWLNIRHRGLKWFEYFGIFYLLKPIVAVALMVFRNGGGFILSTENLNLLSHQEMIFGANTIKLAEYMETYKNYLWGESYYYPLVRFIPRFLWEDKPVAIDYVYKEMVGYSFDGGGIYTTPGFDLYLNFGYLYVFPYAVWLLILHKMYGILLRHQGDFGKKIFILIILISGFQYGALIQHLEIYFILLLIFFCFNKKWGVI